MRKVNDLIKIFPIKFLEIRFQSVFDGIQILCDFFCLKILFMSDLDNRSIEHGVAVVGGSCTREPLTGSNMFDLGPLSKANIFIYAYCRKINRGCNHDFRTSNNTHKIQES